jgi:hypothetical protein
LNRAEKNFDKDNNVRGELNLLLAEAELQRLREAEGRESARRRHILAAGAALFVSLAFWAVFGLWPQEGRPDSSAKNAATREETKPPVTMTGENPPAAIAAASEEKPAVQQTEIAVIAVATPKNEEAGFSESELRGFVKAAGKALRGDI